MLQETTTPEQGSLDLQLESGNTHKQLSSQTTREGLEDTPFTIVGGAGKYFLALGIHRLGDVYDTKEEVVENLKGRDFWRIVTTTISIVCHQINENNKIADKGANNKQSL